MLSQLQSVKHTPRNPSNISQTFEVAKAYLQGNTELMDQRSREQSQLEPVENGPKFQTLDPKLVSLNLEGKVLPSPRSPQMLQNSSRFIKRYHH